MWLNNPKEFEFELLAITLNIFVFMPQI